MIDDLDNTLEKLLVTELSEIRPNKPTVKFDPPVGDFGNNTVDLFLYDMREDRDLRDNRWQLNRTDKGQITRIPPLVRVTCSYLVTGWAGDPKSEHRLLFEVLKVLLRYPKLPAAYLHGSLQGQEPPLPTTTLQPGHLQSIGEFWQALGGKPKAALNYTVTVGVEVGEPIDVGPPVTEKRINFHSM